MNKRKKEILIGQFKADKGYMVAAVYLTLIVIIALLAGLINQNPEALDVTKMMNPPSFEHWLGTDELGRDYLIRVIYGARVSLLVGVLAMLTSMIIGVTVGLAAGYFGGIVDSVLMRIVDIFCAIPWVIMVTVVSMILKKGLVSIVVVIGFFSWMEIARLVRAETMSIRTRDFVIYAELVGSSKKRIMAGHIMGMIMPVIITAATAAIANAIMVESAMSFLGIGIQPPMTSWGTLLQTAQKNLASAPLMAFVPGVLIVCTVCAFNKLGELARIYFEPQVRAEVQ